MMTKHRPKQSSFNTYWYWWKTARMMNWIKLNIKQVQLTSSVEYKYILFDTNIGWINLLIEVTSRYLNSKLVTYTHLYCSFISVQIKVTGRSQQRPHKILFTSKKTSHTLLLFHILFHNQSLYIGQWPSFEEIIKKYKLTFALTQLYQSIINTFVHTLH